MLVDLKGEPETGRLPGVNGVSIQIYALSGLLAGFTGLLPLAQYGTTTIAGQSLTNLNVIAAVVTP